MNNKAEQKQLSGSTETRYEDFAGSQQCAACHQEIFDSHLLTAHHLTGQPADKKFIKGSFEKGKNSYWYSPLIEVAMEKRDSGLFQVAYYKGEEKKAMRFDIVMGSGAKGQSFLTWRNDRLFQLPVTYFTIADKWSNSPGFPSGRVTIDRPITARCLECHTSYAETSGATALEPVAFNHDRILYGVNCEKCHGPAKKHVEFQTEHPAEVKGRYIVNPAALSRQQNLDLCALCHGGKMDKIKPSFQFIAGQNLSDFFSIDTLQHELAISTGNADVHGNQYGLLKASKCFKMSITMTCNTCHNSHLNERGKTEIFSQRCITCHNTKADSFKTPGHKQITRIEENCIDCHMPAQPSKAIAVFLEGEETPRASLVRSHFISIYPEETKKLKMVKIQ